MIDKRDPRTGPQRHPAFPNARHDSESQFEGKDQQNAEQNVQSYIQPSWTRREWLARNSAAVLVAANPALWRTGIIESAGVGRGGNRSSVSNRSSVGSTLACERSARAASHAELLDRGPLEELAKRAVDAARTAGASYADARLTREVQHRYEFNGDNKNFVGDVETIGIGVRTLVDGYWGFSASAVWEPDEVVRLARDAVSQARVNAKGTPRTVDMGHYPAVTGTWSTPVSIDPFTIMIEEKQDSMDYWEECTKRAGLFIAEPASFIHFARQERVVATTEGSCFTQTLCESGGLINVQGTDEGGIQPSWIVQGIDVCGKGWELFLDAKIPEQIKWMQNDLHSKRAAMQAARGFTIGRYTLVCDGATMASLVEQTFGIATQLDRALGYEANASGTSYIDDPLGMVGHLQVASPKVTVTSNRSAVSQLSTVKWDDEGVEPQERTLVKDGVLTDLQTTREQASWLAPYYEKKGIPVRSQGCAAAEDALSITMQHMPNLALEPGASTSRLEDLIANVKSGLLIRNGCAKTDHQARNGTIAGVLSGTTRGEAMEVQKIINGRLGPLVDAGTAAIQFSTMDIWRHVTAVGGPVTREVVGYTGHNYFINLPQKLFFAVGKGQPLQLVSHSVSGVAATIENQPVINLTRKA